MGRLVSWASQGPGSELHQLFSSIKPCNNALMLHTEWMETYREWFLHKMLLWFLYRLYFLCCIKRAACHSFSCLFIHAQFIFSTCLGSYWYMLKGCSVTGNLITQSSTCQFCPSLSQPTLLFMMWAPQSGTLAKTNASPLTTTIDCKPVVSESLISKCIFGSIIILNIHNLVYLSIVNVLHELNLKARSIIQT